MDSIDNNSNERLARCAMALGKIEPGHYELVRNKVLLYNEKTGEKEECWHIFSQVTPFRPG